MSKSRSTFVKAKQLSGAVKIKIMLVNSEKTNGADFFFDEYSSGFKVSRFGYSSKILFLEEAMFAAKKYLGNLGRPIPEKDNLLVVGDGYYTMNFKTGEITPDEKTDNRPLRRSR